MEWDAHCKDREGIQVHSGWWLEGVENTATGGNRIFPPGEKNFLLRQGSRNKTRKIIKSPKQDFFPEIISMCILRTFIWISTTYHGNFFWV